MLIPAKVLLDICADEGAQAEAIDETWYGGIDGDHWCAIPFGASALYRGQTAIHLPFLPAIGRLLSGRSAVLSEMPTNDQAQIILAVAQAWWFARELEHHPVTTHAVDQRLKLDRIGMAQHYGIPTGYLDLTHNLNVATFFATCCERPDGQWEPARSGVGVVYRAPRVRIVVADSSG
jgi:hypothetical protein